MWLVRIVAGEFQRIIDFNGTTDFGGAAVIQRPTAVVALATAQIRSEFAFEFVIDLAQVVHHQDIFGWNGAIGPELKGPVAIGVLRAQQRADRTVNCVLNSGQRQLVGSFCFRARVIEPGRAVLQTAGKSVITECQTALSSAPAPSAGEQMLDVLVKGKPRLAAQNSSLKT